MSELNYMPAYRLAAMILERQVSAVAVLNAHLEQISRHNPTLNAIATLDEEGARTRAGAADAALACGEVWGPLHGVPSLSKMASLPRAYVRPAGTYPGLILFRRQTRQWWRGYVRQARSCWARPTCPH